MQFILGTGSSVLSHLVSLVMGQINHRRVLLALHFAMAKRAACARDSKDFSKSNTNAFNAAPTDKAKQLRNRELRYREQYVSQLIRSVANDLMSDSEVFKENRRYKSILQTPLRQSVLQLQNIALALETSSSLIDSENQDILANNKEFCLDNLVCETIEVMNCEINEGLCSLQSIYQKGQFRFRWEPPAKSSAFLSKISPESLATIVRQILKHSVEQNRFTPNLSVTCTLSRHEQELILCITHNGKGIPYNLSSIIENTDYAVTDFGQRALPNDLLGIKAMLSSVNGKLSIVSALNFRTKIFVTLSPASHEKVLDYRTKTKSILNQQLVSRKEAGISILPAKERKIAQGITEHSAQYNSNDVCYVSVAQTSEHNALANTDKKSSIEIMSANNVSAHQTVSNYMPEIHTRVVRLCMHEQVFIKKLVNVLQEHSINYQFKRPEAANYLSMAEKTLSSKLNKIYGMGFSRLLSVYRLNQAKELIKQGYSVTQATYEVGFNSPSYFTVCFKAQFGHLPSELG